MRPILVTSAASGFFSGTPEPSWDVTIPDLGKNGLIVVAGVGAETGGETNPEEINVVGMTGLVGGGYFTPILGAGANETFMGMYYIKGAQIPGAGTYTISINYKDSPKQAERKRGICAVFRNVRDLAPEASVAGTGSNSPRSVNITPLSINALVIAAWGWRVGFAETWNWGTPIVTSRGDNSSGITMAYSVIQTPAQQTPSCGATNPEDNGMVAAAFAPRKDSGGGFIS